MSNPSMRRDIVVRALGGVHDAHYAVLRYDPRKGETLWDAVPAGAQAAQYRLHCW